MASAEESVAGEGSTAVRVRIADDSEAAIWLFTELLRKNSVAANAAG
jgi:hypothetical protein